MNKWERRFRMQKLGGNCTNTVPSIDKPSKISDTKLCIKVKNHILKLNFKL